MTLGALAGMLDNMLSGTGPVGGAAPTSTQIPCGMDASSPAWEGQCCLNCVLPQHQDCLPSSSCKKFGKPQVEGSIFHNKALEKNKRRTKKQERAKKQLWTLGQEFQKQAE